MTSVKPVAGWTRKPTYHPKGTGEYRCYLCGVRKTSAHFYADSSRHTGNCSRCKDCQRWWDGVRGHNGQRHIDGLQDARIAEHQGWSKLDNQPLLGGAGVRLGIGRPSQYLPDGTANGGRRKGAKS